MIPPAWLHVAFGDANGCAVYPIPPNCDCGRVSHRTVLKAAEWQCQWLPGSGEAAL